MARGIKALREEPKEGYKQLYGSCMLSEGRSRQATGSQGLGRMVSAALRRKQKAGNEDEHLAILEPIFLFFVPSDAPVPLSLLLHHADPRNQALLPALPAGYGDVLQLANP